MYDHIFFIYIFHNIVLDHSSIKFIMVKNIENIINNLNIKSNYDNLEYVNNVLNYCIKSIDYKHKKINILPMLPDYTIDEIRDMALNS